MDGAPSIVSKEGRKPAKQPPVLFDQTQALIKAVEEAFRMPTLAYWNSWRGNICGGDVPSLYELLERRGPLDRAAIFIKSSGGDIEVALRIVHLLRRYIRHLIALVPSECASAATVMALGADEIRMGPLAYLTPTDTSLMHDLSPIDQIRNGRVRVSRDELMRIVRLWSASAKDHHGNPYPVILHHIHPLVVGAIDRSSSLSAKICEEVLAYHIEDGQRRGRISTALASEFPSHSYPITDRAARQLGLTIKPLEENVNRMLLDLSEL